MKYFEHELALTQYQLKQLADAIEKRKKVTLRLSIDQLTFKTDDTKLKVLLTQTQIGRINKHVKEDRGLEIDFSLNQLREMSKSGGVLPLLTLLPLIFGGLSAAGAVAGTVGDQVHKKLQRDEAQRHNKAVEEEVKKAGLGLFVRQDGNGLFLAKEGGSMQLNERDVGELFSQLLSKKSFNKFRYYEIRPLY